MYIALEVKAIIADSAIGKNIPKTPSAADYEYTSAFFMLYIK